MEEDDAGAAKPGPAALAGEGGAPATASAWPAGGGDSGAAPSLALDFAAGGGKPVARTQRRARGRGAGHGAAAGRGAGGPRWAPESLECVGESSDPTEQPHSKQARAAATAAGPSQGAAPAAAAAAAAAGDAAAPVLASVIAKATAAGARARQQAQAAATAAGGQAPAPAAEQQLAPGAPRLPQQWLPRDGGLSAGSSTTCNICASEASDSDDDSVTGPFAGGGTAGTQSGGPGGRGAPAAGPGAGDELWGGGGLASLALGGATGGAERSGAGGGGGGAQKHPTSLADFPQNLLFGVPAPPPPLRRMIAGLAALGPVIQLEPTPAAGPWCADVPVFGNPLIRDVYPSGPRGLQIRPVPEVGGGRAGYARTLVRSLGDLVRVQRWAAAWPEALAHDANAERAEWADVQALLAAVPAGWEEAARAAPLPPLPPRGTRMMPARPPDPAALWAEADLVPSLGWRLYQGSRAVPVLLTKLTVKQATLLQLAMPGGVDTQRRDKHVAFACLALGLAPPTQRALPPAAGQQPAAAQPVPAAAAPDPAAAVAAAAAAAPRLQQPRWPAWTGPPSTPRLPRELALTASVRIALRKLWRLRWDNAAKEVY
ncbi:hypothetical protein HT031_001862 [Scenedesmus sp. PABB004]|nr:hypothetical protein HT031_001862 [Scenedesmus sp. PABB004]